MLPGGEELRRFLFSLLSEEERNQIMHGKKVVNKQKEKAFEEIFERLLLKAMQQGFRVRANRYHPFPRSGDIIIVGNSIQMDMLTELLDVAAEISTVEVLLDGREVMIVLTFNGMIDLI